MRGIAAQAPRLCDAFIVTMGDEARLAGESLVRSLRLFGVKADLDHCARSMKAQFKYADKLGAQKVVILAGDELEKGIVKIRDMESHEETEVPLSEAVQVIKRGVY
ncbi:MAG: histidine--tRNA ligase, partial [Clostridia bacterium]|nr:histidine--tRNA ligase [Clostridia bacterium]